MKKKLVIILLIFVLLIAQIGIMNFLNASNVLAVDKGTEWNRYFYNQLKPNAKNIYDAMFDMYANGIFAKGESMEITDKVSASSVALFVNGNNELLNDYGAARDAFQYDYPDCFYVDWDNLSVRVTQDQTGKLHAFLGAGRTDTYLLKGMNEQRTDKANNGHGTGIKGAVEEYETKISEVVNKIREDASNISDKNEKIAKMAGDAHDYVTKNMKYKHEWETSKDPDYDNRKSTSRTVYDGLILGEGVCEAYTRTFKAICDRLQIPCICVYGIYSPKSSINEPHIWNYVQIDEKWYGVDVTHDDPTVLGGMFENNTNENRDYFLVGQNQLSAHHFPQGIVSSANYEFKYPTLEDEAYRDSYLIETEDGFSILVEKDTELDNWDGNEPFDSGTFYVSYEGMNFSQNAARGKYIVAKYYNYNPGTDTWDVSDWSYIDPWLVLFGNNERIEEIEPQNPKNGKYCTRLELGQTKGVQFAITETPPAYLDFRKELETNGFTEDLSNRLATALAKGAAHLSNGTVLNVSTTKIENKWGDYVAPPIPTKLTPGGCLYIGQKHHLKMEFNDKLKLKTENASVGIDVSVDGGAGLAGNWNAGHSALDYYKIENIKWDGDKTVEFDFTPSDMYADNSCFYNFQVTGLIGNSSNRTPVAGTFAFRYPCACFAYAAQGYNRNVYAQPQLMETSDVDMSNWLLQDVDTQGGQYGKQETMKQFMDEIAQSGGDSQEFLDSLHDRLTLVTVETPPAQAAEMKEKLETNKETSSDYKKALEGTINTYNISITVCKKMVLKTGESAHISLGFPKGTTYEDFAENGRLSFKAYHYIVDPETNKLTDKVEEIRVTVTRQGLVLWVDSFSPFTVMAIENDKPVNVTEKEVLTASTLGGNLTESGKKLEGNNSGFKLNAGQAKNITITPDEGYEIDYIMVDGVRQSITNKAGQDIQISYDSVETGNVLNVGFVAKQIHEAEKAQNLSSDFEIPNVDITLEKTQYDFVTGESFEIKPKVIVAGGNYNPTGEHPDKLDFQWYKETGGRPSPIQQVDGQTSNDLVISSAINGAKNSLETHNGKWYLVVKIMKWNSETNQYEPMKKDKYVYSKYSNPIYINLHNKLELDIKNDETKPDIKLEGDKTSGYTLQLGVNDEYKLTADVYRMNGEVKQTDGSDVTWTSSNPNCVSVDESGDLKVHEYTAEPVTITATVTDYNGVERKVDVKVTLVKVEPSSITLDKTEVTLEVEQAETLTATLEPEDVSSEEVTFTSSDDGIVSVKKTDSNKATITAKKIGTASITATVGDKSATCSVTVKQTEVTSLSSDFDGTDIYLVEPSADGTGTDTSVKIAVNVLPDNATNKEVEWKSSDESIAKVTVDENGYAIITPVADSDDVDEVRECTVTVTSKSNPSVSLVYSVHVSEHLVKVESVKIVADKTEVTLGEEIDLTAHIEPQDADVKSVSWEVVEGKDVIDINSSGEVITKKTGKAKVVVIVECQAFDCGARHKSKPIEITVNPVYAEKIELDKTNITLRKDNTDTIKATVLPVETTDKTVTWKSSNSNIVEVDENGNITAKAVGNATITASCPNATATCKVEVTPVEVERLHISHETLKLNDKIEDGTHTKLEVTYEPHNADNVKLKWESSDTTVATVDENGIVTPLKPGNTTITVSVEGKPEIKATCEVEVVPYETEVVVYTVDQKDNFLPGFTLRLVKLDGDGTERLVKEITSEGKFDFGKLTDGNYKLYTSSVTEKDFNGNEVYVIDILEFLDFIIEDGEIILAEGENFIGVDAIVLKNIVDYPDSENEDKLVATAENVKDNTEARYQEFIKTKPTEPEKTKDPVNPKPNQGKDESKDPAKQPSVGGGGSAPSAAGNPVGAVNTQNNSPLPKTSDIAIGTFVTVMVISLAGIIYIIYKKNKR